MRHYTGKHSKTTHNKKHIKTVVVILCLITTLVFSITAGRSIPNSIDTISRTTVFAKSPFTNINESIEKLTSKIIIRATKAKSITLNKSSAKIDGIDKTLQLTNIISPANTTNKNVTYTSSNTNVATVSAAGIVTPVLAGTAQIDCYTVDGTNLKASCTVVVSTKVNAEKIRLNKPELTFNKPTDKALLTATILPNNVTNPEVIWKSSDNTIAVVDKTGLVKPVSNGTAVISCVSKENEQVATICEVSVKMPVKASKIVFNYSSIDYIGLGCMEQLKPTFYPEYTTNQKVKYESSDPAIARVDSDGFVYPVANGECVITCLAQDGSKAKATCAINVSGILDYVPVTSYDVVIPDYVDVNSTESTVIDEAQKYVGWLPYVWGGTSLTEGVDCSGFICAVYQKFGYNLWDMRTELGSAGTSVSNIAQAKAGDILVYSGHVAIYDGNGGKIHAPDEGYMVSHDYSLGNYHDIRRILP